MRLGRLVSIAFFIFSGIAFTSLQAQPTWTLDPFGSEKKPEQYEEKKLGSEKTAEKKWTPFRHLVQNTVTRYNYYFNANNKVNYVLEQAMLSNQDDYSKLLPFYPYTLETTAGFKNDLDSVINKATAGILLHDLRNDWIDDLYLLMGKAYFFMNELDTAVLTFQYINYNMYPRKKGENDDRIVGSNANEAGGMFSIADKEQQNALQRALMPSPCRNDALIWLTRSFIEAEMYGDAGGMINILFADQNLPSRLRDDLEEVAAYWFYRQEQYDSCAVHLEKALSNAPTPYERARWEYLLAQLYERSGLHAKATEHYLKSAKIALDPVMDIYAHLNNAKMQKDKQNLDELKENLQLLLNMARKDKYHAYRDIIYNAAGNLSVMVPDTAFAINCFLKSLKYNEGNEKYRVHSLQSLAGIYYDQRDYRNAAAYYDSIDIENPDILGDTSEIADRKSVLNRVVGLLDLISAEDSLQRIARMSPAERDALIRHLVKKYKKEKGIPETNDNAGYAPLTFNNSLQADVTDLFTSPSKGDWYFYNSSMRKKGYDDFKIKWGTRANTDNWRRIRAADAAMQNLNANIDIDAPVPADSSDAGSGGLVPFSYDALMANIPLAKEQLDSSNAIIRAAMFQLAMIFQAELEDYPEAVRYYEEFLSRFPDAEERSDVYMGLYFCLNKMGETAKANDYKNRLLQEFSGSQAAKTITDPKSVQSGPVSSEENAAYQHIYQLFIEGKFNEAIAAKERADSISGTDYWTPQLLYIQAVYYVKQREDDLAIGELDALIERFPESPLVSKAETLKDVVSRRAEIEAYLNDLQVTRETEEKIIVSDNRPAPPAPRTIAAPAQPSMAVLPQTAITRPAAGGDTLRNLPGMTGGGFVLKPDDPHIVLMVLSKVDGVYVTEAYNAMSRFTRDNPEYRTVTMKKEALDANSTFIEFSVFEDAAAAVVFVDKMRKKAPNYVSWLPSSKYSFLIITESNLSLLRQNKDVGQYRNLLNANYGNKF